MIVFAHLKVIHPGNLHKQRHLPPLSLDDQDQQPQHAYLQTDSVSGAVYFTSIQENVTF
jgi:hypothetical protein